MTRLKRSPWVPAVTVTGPDASIVPRVAGAASFTGSLRPMKARVCRVMLLKPIETPTPTCCERMMPPANTYRDNVSSAFIRPDARPSPRASWPLPGRSAALAGHRARGPDRPGCGHDALGDGRASGRPAGGGDLAGRHH